MLATYYVREHAIMVTTLQVTMLAKCQSC